jgi:hypothetical protein
MMVPPVQGEHGGSPSKKGCLGILLLAFCLSSASVLLVLWQDHYQSGNLVSEVFLAVGVLSDSMVVPAVVLGAIHIAICSAIAYEVWPSSKGANDKRANRIRLVAGLAIYSAYTALLAFLPTYGYIKM